MKYSAGVTLVELMLTLAVMAILVSLAAPSFNETIARSRLGTQSNELVAALNLARSEAIRRGRESWVGSTSNSATWTSGWDVYSTDAGGVDELLRTRAETLEGNNTLVADNDRVTFDSQGFVADKTPVVFWLCRPEAGLEGRQIEVGSGGRIQVSHETCP